jgi:uncharacterized protein (DUF1330 family)
MPRAYWVVTYRSVKDQQKLAAYVDLAVPAVQAAGGRFLARGKPARIYEGGLMERTTVTEFENIERAVAAYESAAYQRALRALGDAVERDLRIIEGIT